MASSAECLECILDLLAEVPEASARKMMGEYLLYASGKLFGNVTRSASVSQRVSGS